MVALTLLLQAGCDGSALTPTGTGGTAPGPAGRGTRTSGSQLLLGTWQNTMLIAVPNDFERVITTWEFSADGTCRHVTVTQSLVEGIPFTRTRNCRYEVPGSVVRVTYDGAPGSVDFDFTFANFSRDRLVLDGFEFERIA
ncbi:MAG: hypothetical protein HKM89_08495 [Gemmatimonadales bacterium]|nr:hypothetical protein [Gemmatimonadales bacterium]